MAKKRKKARKRTKVSAGRAKHHRKTPRVKKPKKPKKPKVSASVSAWQNYDRRMSDWHKRVSSLIADARQKQNLILKHRC